MKSHLPRLADIVLAFLLPYAPLKDVAQQSPRDFVRAAATLMPKEFEIKTPLDDMSNAELADLILAMPH